MKSYKAEQKKQFKSNIQKIKAHKQTQIKRYPQFKQSYEYIDEYFPFANIKQIQIYLTSHQVISQILGLTCAAGFYSRTQRIIVITKTFINHQNSSIFSDVHADVKNDQVVVHQMLHYVSHFLQRQVSPLMQQQFAYGKSARYLLNKGYSEQFIVNKIYLPYLLSIFDYSSLLKKSVNSRDYNSLPKQRKQQVAKKIIQDNRKYIFQQALKKGLSWIEMNRDMQPLYLIQPEIGHIGLDI